MPSWCVISLGVVVWGVRVCGVLAGSTICYGRGLSWEPGVNQKFELGYLVKELFQNCILCNVIFNVVKRKGVLHVHDFFI